MKTKKNKTLSSLKWEYKQLENKENKSEAEQDEYNEITSFLSTLTIERKKNNKAEGDYPFPIKFGYDYFIADKNGKVVEKLKD